jgi:hypothetical protein
MSEALLLEQGELAAAVSPKMLLNSLGRLARAHDEYRNKEIAGFILTDGWFNPDQSAVEYKFSVFRDDSQARGGISYQLGVETTTPIESIPQVILDEHDVPDTEDPCAKIEASTYSIDTHERELFVCHKTSYMLEEEIVFYTCTCAELFGESGHAIEATEEGILVSGGNIITDIMLPELQHTTGDPDLDLRNMYTYLDLATKLKYDNEDEQFRRALSIALMLQRKLPNLQDVVLNPPLKSGNSRLKHEQEAV